MATMSALEAAVLGELVQARAALIQLRALNGCTHYHDAMRAVTHAANCMGITVQEFDALAKAQREVTG